MALHSEERVNDEAGLAPFLAEFLGPVKEGRGEPVRAPTRIAVIAVANVALDDLLEPRLRQEGAGESVVG
ncbi:MAG TPA: hypothetical protein VF526_05585 [Solirubrobacteraceae bacterium]|jgi:hypothetical protein